MIYALLDTDGKVLRTWNQLNHFTSSSYAEDGYPGHKIAVMELKELASFPNTDSGILQLRQYNKDSKGPLKQDKNRPDDLVPGLF